MDVVYRWANEGVPVDAEVVLAVDILRAGTTIVSAFERGARTVLVTGEVASAVDLAAREGGVLVGERGAQRIPGFAFDNSPAAMTRRDVPDKLVFTSSNFPRTLRGIGDEVEIVVGSLRNISAAVAHCLRAQVASGGPVAVVLAGAAGEPCDEDLAFMLGVARRAAGSSWDSERLATVRREHRGRTLQDLVRRASHANRLRDLGCSRDVELASQVDACDVVPTGRKVRGRDDTFLFRASPPAPCDG